MPPYRPLAERFWEKVNVGTPDECWTWAACTNPLGYGWINVNNSGELAHRISWLINHGEIPEGLVICHKCDNPPCVNPNHLFLGTQKDNMQDYARKGLHHCAIKTHCKQGHEFSPENTRVYDGKRYCMACNRKWGAETQERIKMRKHLKGGV
jgi:hypothetical protein